ncbi:ABC transporter permease, partial [uncultured Mucilaginibacter sp.]|uniref:ABC transporter permease n=1 Tax=uncultured Mucilaginibacter sp. TaxID=797541 RepID=UPI0025DFCB69
IKNYLKSAFINMYRNKTYTLINIFGLSIGLACVMLITLYIKDEVSFDRFNTNGASVYRVVQDGRSPDGSAYKNGFTSGVEGITFKQEIPEINEFCRINGGGSVLVKKGGDVISEPILYADKSIFKIFSFPLLSGKPGAVLNSANALVITEDLAKKYFGNTDAVGKVLQINVSGKFSPFIITGVAKNVPQNSTLHFSLLMSIEPSLPKSSTPDDWFSMFLNTFVYVRPGADAKNVERKMNAIFNYHAGKKLAEYKKQFGQKLSVQFNLEPYYKVHLGEYGIGNGLRPSNKVDYSLILGGIAAFILFIACINFINLTLSRSLRRAKEIGIRKVNGSSRAQLIVQFMGESFLLTLIASLISVMILVACLPEFNELANKNLEASYLLTWQSAVIFSLLIVVNTFLSGFYPAMVLSGFNPVQILYGKLKISGHNYFGKSLVVVQFVIAVFLAIGTIVMLKQFNYLVNSDLGYKPQDIVDLQLPHDFPVFKSDLSKYPFIKSISGQMAPFTSVYADLFEVGDKKLTSTSTLSVDNEFLNELNIPVVQGHGFYNMAGDTTEVLVNQSFVKAAGWQDSPLGKKIKQGKQELTVIGLVHDFHSAALNYKISPLVIQQLPKPTYGDVLVKIDPNQKVKAIEAMQHEYKKLIADAPIQYNFLTDELADQYDSVNKWKQIITISAAISIFISCLGLFGLATLSIEQRVKEIGVRKVLGASIANISVVLMTNFLKLVFIAIVIASPLAWYAMNKWLEDYPYRINMGWWVLVSAGLGALIIACTTIVFQSVKAALANPVKSLRSE